MFFNKLYTKNGRLADILALIQVLGLSPHTRRSDSGLDTDLPKTPKSSSTWRELADEHPEFFRVNEEAKFGISLIARFISARNGAEGDKPLSSEEVKNLLNVAVELHDREARRAEKIVTWLTLVAAIVAALGTFMQGCNTKAEPSKDKARSSLNGLRYASDPYPLTLTLSLGERGQLSSRSDYLATRVVNPVAGISLKRSTFLPLLGERAGVRAGVTT